MADSHLVVTSKDVLGKDGWIARRMQGYEERAEQLQMADAVAQAIANKSNLLVEAGTGVGKSFAYLVPALLAATNLSNIDAARLPDTSKLNENRLDAPQNSDGLELAEASGDRLLDDEAKPKRVIVSTHTISLQEQLIQKDIPLLRSIWPEEFSAVLVKGRGNYLSRRRTNVAVNKSKSLLFEGQADDQLQFIANWMDETSGGSKSDLEFKPQPSVWAFASKPSTPKFSS